jgi:hypothetical protein
MARKLKFEPTWKHYLIAGILIAEIGVLSLLAWTASSSPTDGIAVRADQAALRVPDQKAVTSSITVEWIVAPGPTWVVVQSDYGTGSGGTMIGKAHVDAGETINLEIGLETTTVPRTATVSLIADRGEVGKFEYTGEMASGGMGGSASSSASADKPYVANGAFVTMPFSITPLTFKVGANDATLGTLARGPDGSTVTASGAFVIGRSWLSVSLETTGGVPGEVIGVTPLAPGGTSPVNVRLLNTVGKDTPLFATLHADLGQPGQFEYSTTDVGNSPDQPYVAGGQTVRVQVPPAR